MPVGLQLGMPIVLTLVVVLSGCKTSGGEKASSPDLEKNTEASHAGKVEAEGEEHPEATAEPSDAEVETPKASATASEASTEDSEENVDGPGGRVLLYPVKDKGIWEALHGKDAKLRLCYLDNRKTDPGLAGKIKMKLTVTGGKTISKVQKTGDTTGSEALWKCVYSLIQGASVHPIESCPAGVCPDTISIDWGVTFQPGDKTDTE